MDFLKSLGVVAVLLGPCLYFGFYGKSVEMGISVAAGALALAFMNLDKIQKFKGAGVEVEMAQQVIKEVHVTMERLKEVTTPLITGTLISLTYGGRWGGISDTKQLELVSRIEEATRSIKSPEIEEAIEEFYKMTSWDYYNHFVSEVLKQDRDAADKIGKCSDRSSSIFPKEIEIKNKLGALWENLSLSASESLKDYLHYTEYRNKRIKE